MNINKKFFTANALTVIFMTVLPASSSHAALDLLQLALCLYALPAAAALLVDVGWLTVKAAAWAFDRR